MDSTNIDKSSFIEEIITNIINNNIVSSFVSSAITQPFFELQTPDFAWKFVWTVPTNYTK